MSLAESASGERELRGLCRATLELNWREGTRDGNRYAYTAPSSGRYPWQWYWDSCFAAIVWRRFDPGRARAELESLLAAATPDGFIGHTIFWAEPVSRVRSLFYNVCSRADFMTATIQPPLLAWAWRIAVGDPAEVPAIVRHHDWIEQHRSLDDDGLVWIIQPDESGLDASPSSTRHSGGAMELVDPDPAAASSHLGAAARSSSSTNAAVNRAASATVAGGRFSGLSAGQ